MAVMLLVYTYFGTLVETESQSVAIAVSEVNWGEIEPKRRFYYRMILHRAQKEVKISAHNLIDCNLISFMVMAKASLNVFTLLQNITRNYTAKS